MNGNSSSWSKRTSSRCGQAVAGGADQVAVDDGQRLLGLRQRRSVAVQDRDVDARVDQPFLDLAARAFEHLQADRRMALADRGEQLADQRLRDRRQEAERDAPGRLAAPRRSTSCSSVSASDSTRITCGSSRCPMSDSSTPRPVRLNRRAPHSRSSALSCRLSSDWLLSSESAARVRLPSFADHDEGAPLLQVGGDVDDEVGGFARRHGIGRDRGRHSAPADRARRRSPQFSYAPREMVMRQLAAQNRPILKSPETSR